ncbi:MAG: two-component regulator propeller domain-containing protein [Chitinivibrionales bacterium]
MNNQKALKSISRCAFLPIVLMIFSVSFAQYPEWTVYNAANSVLPSNLVTSIAIDDSGNKWIGTGGGLSKFDGTKWTVINTANLGWPENFVTAIGIDASGNKWVGTDSYGGLAKFNGANWTVYNVYDSGCPYNSITSIVIDKSGNKWIGTLFDCGLVKFDGTTWTVYSSSNSGLPGNQIQSIAIDSNGNMWIGTTGGLAKFDGTTWTTYLSSNSGLPDNRVYAIAIDRSGNKWIGTLGGLTKFDGASWTVYDTSNSGLPANVVISIAIDGSGNKWMGTETSSTEDKFPIFIPEGLTKFDGATWTVYNTANSVLPNNDVSSIAIDSSGNKWIGTGGGGLAVFSGGNSAIKMNHVPALNLLTPLCSNYPNPFKQKTLISYNVLENGPVSLRIYSLDGHLVQTLVNARQTTGHCTVSWNGTNDRGKIMARGVYLYQLISKSGIISKKMNFIE